MYSFALRVGATANIGGAAIRQAITVVFAANVVGRPLVWSEQVLGLLVAVLINIGTAGVTGAPAVATVVGKWNDAIDLEAGV